MLFLRHIRIVRLMRQRQLAMGGGAVLAGEEFAMRRSRRRAFGEKPKLWEHKLRLVGGKSDKGWRAIMVRIYPSDTLI